MAITAVLWAVGVAVYLLAFATATTESVETSGTPHQPPVTTRTVEQIPFVIFAGTPAIFAVIIFSSLLVIGAVFSWRTALLPATIISILTLVATYITGFTIGGFYFLGVVALCISTLLAFAGAQHRSPANL